MTPPTPITSKIYSGTVRHRRLDPVKNTFQYNVFMLYLNLDEIDDLFQHTRLWQKESWGIAQFKRGDFHGDNRTPLKQAVLNTAEKATGERPSGPVYMLGNLRYFGYIINPLCTYYCFNQAHQLQTIVAEVTNTPWHETHSYVLDVANQPDKQQMHFHKSFHVSPFNPIDMHYQWTSVTPAENALIHLENWREDKKIMDATLTLGSPQTVTAKQLNRMIIRYPFMTLKTVSAIYYQALKLWLKKSPIYPHTSLDPRSQDV